MGAWPSMPGRRHGVAFFGCWLLQLICEMVGIFRFWTIDICRDHELGTRFTRWNGVPDISFWSFSTNRTDRTAIQRQETSILATLDVIAIYFLATGVLVVSSFWQFRTSHAMLLIVNSWSASLLRGDESCIQSKKEPLQVVKIELKEVLGADQLFF